MLLFSSFFPPCFFILSLSLSTYMCIASINNIQERNIFIEWAELLEPANQEDHLHLLLSKLRSRIHLTVFISMHTYDVCSFINEFKKK